VELIARVRYHSKGYISLLERNAAFKALVESQRQLELRNRFIRETFGRYLSDEIVENLLERPEGLALGGEKRKVTIMMADLRGFTSLSERLPPEKVVRMINNFLEEMTEVIVRRRGTIDEFIGDAILAIFGAPELREDDAERAVACALEMQLAMTRVNERNAMEGLPAVEMGVGLNTGEVVVGNIGSTKRAKYGVVGSTVNLTSRVESYTVGGQILLSPSTYEAVTSPLVVDGRMLVEPKGVKKPITLYDVVGMGGAFDLRLPRRADGLVALPRPLDVSLKLLDGKDAAREGGRATILRLSARSAELRAEASPAALSNLKLSLVDPDGTVRFDDLYAKVQKDLGGGTFSVRFTSVPAEAEKHLASLLADAGARAAPAVNP
jgi:adenylate cyclase